MTPNLVHLPNGQVLSVVPVFGGYFFKASELNTSTIAFPAGWTIVLQTEDDAAQYPSNRHPNTCSAQSDAASVERHCSMCPFRDPTLCNDHLYISSISNPPSNDSEAPASPTQQISMMLWASLYWYFHLDQPSTHLSTEQSKNTPEAGRPKGDWRINIKREGVFRGRHLMLRLARMGLLASTDTSVGVNPEENHTEGWSQMFVTRRMYWQLSPKLFLFQLMPTSTSSFSGSPFPSRPSSPMTGDRPFHRREISEQTLSIPSTPSLWSPSQCNPFQSRSHLPTYFPPPPLQYTMTRGIRHPLRPKPPRQGEIFYTRYATSVSQYLSFRTASLASLPVAYFGARTTQNRTPQTLSSSMSFPHGQITTPLNSSIPASDREQQCQLTDVQLLNLWMNNPRVSAAWGEQGLIQHQEQFLRSVLLNNHAFPAIGLWDGKPFGYFELYWAKEDILGEQLGDRIGDFDRGIHVLVGEESFRGKQRLQCWLTALVHWAFLEDQRTLSVVLEPRVDNEKFISHLMAIGFAREGEVAFPHKQSAFMRIRRENFEAPVL